VRVAPEAQAIFLPPSLWDIPRPCPLNHGFSLSKQKADNAGDNGEENRADHHAAHSAEAGLR